MLHRTLGVALVFCLGAAHAGDTDAVIALPEPSILALFGLGVALVGLSFLRRRSDRTRGRKD